MKTMTQQLRLVSKFFDAVLKNIFFLLNHFKFLFVVYILSANTVSASPPVITNQSIPDPCAGVDSSDGDPCTIDACNHSTGVLTHTPSGLIVHPFQISPILCYGGAACVDITAQGGVPPYTGTGTNCNFPAGTTSIAISDSYGCAVGATITLFQPDQLVLTPSSSPTPCGLSLGSVSVVVQFGTPGYNVVWEDALNNIIGNGNSVGNLPGGTYTAFVTDANGCTASTSATVAVQGNIPLSPAPITGAIGVCKGQSGVVFCVQPDPTVSSYIWTLPNGATGSSTVNCISVDFSSNYPGGIICVSAVNSCGASLPSCRAVPLITTKPAKPALISGAPSICAGSLYSCCIPVVGGLIYNWSIGGNNQVSIQSGQGGPCIEVNVPANTTGSFDIKVRALNCKGESDERKISVAILHTPSMPSTISGPSSVCKNFVGTYSINNVSGVAYNWSAIGGPIVVAGQGTNMAAIDFILSTENPGVVTVTASNSCGTSPARNKTININLNCRTSSSLLQADDESETGFLLYPNPASGLVNIDFFSSTNGYSYIAIYDLTGRIVKQLSFTTMNGENHQLIDLSETSKGTYMLRIVTPERQMNKQVFVE